MKSVFFRAMANVVKLFLLIAYWYGRLIGAINYEIDLKTGRTRTTKKATIYAACIQISLLVLTIHYWSNPMPLSLLWIRPNSLGEIVLKILILLRTLCVIFSLLSRWSNRRLFMRLFRSTHRLLRQHPETIQFIRFGIIGKSLSIIAVEFFNLTFGLLVGRRVLSFSQALNFCAMSAFSSISNVVIHQHYLAIAKIRGRYHLLNDELKAVIAEVQSLIPRRRGVFVTKCCYLADQIDEIARTQSDIQELTRHISKVYEIQTFFVAITTYLNIIGGLYTMFCMGKANNITNNAPPIILALAAPCIILFYVDVVLNNWSVFRLLDAHKETVGLLQQRTLFQHGLDPRLELTFESFHLNLARNPFKIRYCSVLEWNRFASFSIYNSLMTNAILLIQYDMQNY